jgi:Fe-S-cluster containining protein
MELILDCRPGCGACCVAPSITLPIPGMPHGKPAGVRCVNLDDTNRCNLWGQPSYPSFCRTFPAMADACGSTNEQAMVLLTIMERDTTPG